MFSQKILSNSCVERAFSSLNNHHILAIPGIACCPACSSTQIDIISECPQCRHNATGYVMCCHQDMRQAEEEGTLMLSFGVFTDVNQNMTPPCTNFSDYHLLFFPADYHLLFFPANYKL